MQVKKISLVLDEMRIAMYSSFLFIIILGFILTRFSTDVLNPENEPTLLYWWYGQSNVCLLFDFPPSAYVLPCFWSITLIFWMIMSFLLWVRQSEAHIAGQISKVWYWFLNYMLFQETLCVIFFTTIFAVNPDLNEMVAGNPRTFIIHSIPFLFMILGLSTLALSDAIYDLLTGYASVKGVRMDPVISCKWHTLLLYPIILFPLSIIKMTLLVNAVSKAPYPVVPWRYVPHLWNSTEVNATLPRFPCTNNDWPQDLSCGGFAWCSNCPDFALTANVLDKLWTVMVLAPPLIKSIYSLIRWRDRVFRLNITIVPRFLDSGASLMTEEDSSYTELSANT